MGGHWTTLEKIWKRNTYNYLQHMEKPRSLEKYNKGLIVSKLMEEKKES